MKKDQEAEYWPRLTNNKALEKKQPISVDWTRYTDEDEEEEAGGGFDTSAMGSGMVCVAPCAVLHAHAPLSATRVSPPCFRRTSPT